MLLFSSFPPSNFKATIPSQSTSQPIKPQGLQSLPTRVCRHLIPTLQESRHRVAMKHRRSSKSLLMHSRNEDTTSCSSYVSYSSLQHELSFLFLTIKRQQNELPLVSHYYNVSRPQTRKPQFTKMEQDMLSF